MNAQEGFMLRDDIPGAIANLIRQNLENCTIGVLPIWGQLENVAFLRVLGLARFWEGRGAIYDQPLHYEQYMEDLIAGTHGQGVAFLYLVLSNANQVQVYVGLQEVDESLLRASLEAAFPGIQLDRQANFHLGKALKGCAVFNNLGRMTGIPTRKSPVMEKPGSDRLTRGKDVPSCGSVRQIERLLRGLYGQEWGYLVRAVPENVGATMDRIRQRQEDASLAATCVRRQINLQQQGTRTETQAVSYEQTNREAQHLVELLERELARLDRGKAQGMWQVETYAFASQPAVLARMLALLRSIFSGSDSTPEPIRTFQCKSGAPVVPHDVLVTCLNSFELATLCQLPREEFPGYRVMPYARFDVSLPMMSDEAMDKVRIGRVLDISKETGNWYTIARRDLAKHSLVVGVTGSGKTNTCFQILDQIWQRGQKGCVPFLVIEPAKTEYRDLLAVRDANGRLCFPGLRVFTLGDERVAPFRLNPFEFEILDEEHHVHVQTHIDHLKSVFNAAFILYAPMPYVLERCLHEVYQDKGWDLSTSRNRRISTMTQVLPDVFPTLADLYDKVEEVVDALGYEERLELDIKAALQTRINSLRIGGKGLMLDTRQSIPMKELLEKPTVLELESIGDDEEKAFIIGLLLARIYEYRVTEARQFRTQKHKMPVFQHLTLIEEAHRLLRHVPIDADTETANAMGKAVETFTNMLSEVRAYGEGVVVSEQIPTKLSPDVVKNTNLKVFHRLVAQDDRELIGSTMNFDENQVRFVATLNVGQASVFAEGEDGPILILIDEHAATKNKGQVADRDIVALMQGFCTGEIYSPYPACPKHCRAMATNAGRCLHSVRDQAGFTATQLTIAGIFAGWVLGVVEDRDCLTEGYPVIRDAMKRLSAVPFDDDQDIILCAIIQAARRFFERKARQYAWSLDIASSLETEFLSAAANLVHEYNNGQEGVRQILRHCYDALEHFGRMYQQQCKRDIGPYLGCHLCTRKCLYRYEVQRVAGDQCHQDRLLSAIRSIPEGDSNDRDSAMWERVGNLCLEAASSVIVADDDMVLHRVALCYAASVGARLGFSPAGQEKLVEGLLAWTKVR